MRLDLERQFRLLALFSALLFLTLLPILPWRLASNYHDLGRLAQGVLFLLVLPCVVLRLIRHGFPLPSSKPSGLIQAMLIVLIGASCGFADMPVIALRELTLMVALAAVAYAVAVAVSDGTGKLWLIRGSIIAPAVYCASFLLVVGLSLAAGLALDNDNLVFGYDNIRFLNHAQTIDLPLLAGVLGLDAGILTSRWRKLAWFALAVNFSLLVLTRGRGTMVALTAVAVVASLAFGAIGRRTASRLLIGVMAGILIHILVYQWLASLLTGVAIEPMPMGELDSVRARLFLWRRAAEMIASSPWLGVGPMHFAHVPGRPIGLMLEDAAGHPHNVYFQMAAEYGLPAAVMLLTGVFLALARRAGELRMTAACPYRSFLVGAWLACVAAAVDGLFSGNFVMPVSQVWIAVAVGLLFARRTENARAFNGTASLGLGSVLSILLVASTCWLLWVMSAEWLEGPMGAGVHISEAMGQPAGQNRPRFWSNGWF